MAVIDHWTGARATALRHAMRLSIEGYADQLGVSVGAINRWAAKPDTVPYTRDQQILDTVLTKLDDHDRERFWMLVAPPGSPANRSDAVDLPDFGHDVSDDEDMRRRQFLMTAAATVAGVGLPGLDGTGRSVRLNAANVDELETVTDIHRRLYHSMPARSMWPLVEGHLRLLTDLARRSQSEPVHRRVAALGGEAAGLLAWLAFDLGHESGRERMYDIALSLTAAAEDPSLDAYVRGFRSQVRQLEGRPRAALDLASQAVATAGPGRGSLHAWLKSQQAVALAEVKDGPGSLEALSDAENALAGDTENEPAWMYEFDHPRLTAVRGDCLLRLDRPAEAENAFRQALTERAGSGGRSEVELLTGMATATARQGRVEEACALGLRSLDSAMASSELGISRVRQLRRELDRWHGTDAVVAFDARLAAA